MSYGGKAWENKICYVIQPLQTVPLCSSTLKNKEDMMLLKISAA
jgi:hypothetical protein